MFNGWIEQGGRAAASGGNADITFNIAHSNTNVQVLAYPRDGVAKGYIWMGIENVSTTGCHVSCDGSNGDAPSFDWVSFGY